MKCKQCLTDKDLDFFYLYKNGNPMGICKACYNLKQTEWRLKNPERRKAISKKYHENNKYKAKQYYLDNKKSINEMNKSDYYKKRNHYLELGKKYRDENRSEINARQREKRLNNKKIRSDRYMENCILRAIRRQRPSKPFFNLVGYSLKELEQHLFNICPNEYLQYLKGDNNYHIDHIIPKSAFLYENKTDKECLKCWDKANIRIIPKEENFKKADKINFNLIKKHNIKHLLPEGGHNWEV